MNPPQYSTCNVMIKSVHLPQKPCQHLVRVRKRSQTGCVKNSPFTVFLLSALSQNDMQFIPGEFYKPFSLILRCKSPLGNGRAQCITAFRAARQACRHADRKTEDNAANCRRIEWEAGYYLGKKVGAEKEEDSFVSVWSPNADSEVDSEAGIRAGVQEDRQADR